MEFEEKGEIALRCYFLGDPVWSRRVGIACIAFYFELSNFTFFYLVSLVHTMKNKKWKAQRQTFPHFREVEVPG